MKKRLVFVTVSIVLLLFGAMELKKSLNLQETFGRATLKYGSKGSDVRELQGRLHHLGYYKGKIDGSFGYSTLKAVKTFQWKFGMKVDGVVGSKTKLKLWQATKSWRPSATSYKTKAAGGVKTIGSANHLGLSANDLKIMANAVHGESRGEPYVGQVAVAAVILNRVSSERFPNTVSGVIFQPGAFTAVADGQIWLAPNETSKKAVRDALNGYDPTGGAIYYFNPATATSKWIWSRPQIKRIGKHIFCK
ncbi:spore cortex-lytic enzyme [Ferviditalea candida]|uniref:Spore cortex-lytic enzyme n=1 Tax=Ferviditalea candida TaxID=3108399 RepID=A0ABU5ZNE1_9BACL|nr:spore cortex-lytic enzyme [Paenibacillaceae bacterium T2]